jgi:hypothetical protein
MAKFLGANLSELLRHGAQFGLGVQDARRQNVMQQQAVNMKQQELLRQALLDQANIDQSKASAERDRDYGQSLLNKPPEPYDLTQIMGLARPELEGDTVDTRGVANRIRQQYGTRIPAGLENEAISRILQERANARRTEEDQRLQREAAARASGTSGPSWQLIKRESGEYVERNPESGEIRPAQYGGVPFVDEPTAKAPTKPNVTEMQAYLNYPSLEAATGVISNAIQENPSIANNPMLLAGSGGIRGALARPFMNEDEQVFGSAIDRVLATLIYIKSGKQVTVQEARRLAGGYIPAFADKNASAQVKVSALMDEVENMRPVYEQAKRYYDYQRGGNTQSPASVGPQLPTGRNPYRNQP